MKIAKEFRAFLEMYEHLYLPHIGRFELSTKGSDINGSSGYLRYITFIADKTQHNDPELIAFSSEHLKVESCIAESDLSCFCNSINELLIQGFEAEIPGIGFLHYEAGNQLKFSVKSIYHNAVETKKKKLPVAFTASFWM
jgi:hypothetical protein